jgi:DNA-binding transcriptional LysR family regulator
VRPSGTVRITTTDTLLPLVAPCLARIRREHPEIVLEVVVSNTLLSLNRRDADIAIRPTRQPPPELIGRRIARIAFAIYAAAGDEEPTGLATLTVPGSAPTIR